MAEGWKSRLGKREIVGSKEGKIEKEVAKNFEVEQRGEEGLIGEIACFI